ncbi:MAG: PEP-CTERM sorting domain-containing protein [Pirellulales bacterium]|nr:PEP-CTERM sorting domain-containing protein [Pirellulales bacterium]
MKQRTFVCTACAALLGWAVLAPLTAAAAPVLLEDNNSSLVIDTSSPFAGAFDWRIDGLNQLKRQWFWYRIGDSGPESAIDTLLQGPAGATDTNFDGELDTYFVRYLGPDFTLDLRYGLNGGTSGSNSGSMSTDIIVTNTGSSALFFNLFAYSDFDVNGTILNDTVQFVNANAVRQKDGVTVLEAAYSPPSAHHEASYSGFTLASLLDGGPTTLSDLPPIAAPPMGPSDLTWTLQWIRKIDPGQSMPISMGTTVSVPEPSTLVLLLGGIASFGLWRRRRATHV